MAKTFDDKKIIYTMNDVSRAYGTKVVLKNISISYYYGAKIGVIGANGSGKSSLFKILAGKDTEFTGETSLLPGYTIGYLEQEPELEAGKTVMEIVKEGKNLLIGFNPKFFIEALRVIDDEEVTLYMTNPKAPCFIKNTEESYIYLILPVNFTTVN